MSKILRHLATWQPRLSPPLAPVRETIASCLWWQDVKSMEFINGRSFGGLSLSSREFLATRFVRLRMQFGIEVKHGDLEGLFYSSAWSAISARFNEMLVAQLEPRIVSTVTSAFWEAVVNTHLIQRYRPDGGFHKDVYQYLQVCLLGNYPFAVDDHGVAYVLCA